MASTPITPDTLGEASKKVMQHYQQQLVTRRIYTGIAIVVFLALLFASLDFANSANSGKFFERLPYFFDFMKTFLPNSPMEVVRAMFDLPSPYADGSLKYDYVSERVYIGDGFYIPHFFYQLIITLNIALVSTLIGTAFAFALCFFASTNLVGAGAVRFAVRRMLEVMRAFPEIVIAGLLTAILSLGPIAAIVAITIHTVGALGKLFFEVVENADMKPDEGCGHRVPTGWSGYALPSCRRYCRISSPMRCFAPKSMCGPPPSSVLSAAAVSARSSAWRSAMITPPRPMPSSSCCWSPSSLSTSFPAGCAAG